tara:strand:+ start:1286 stop:1627 length:342 start_codon:yes stop_codon:yes gene_type:complete
LYAIDQRLIGLPPLHPFLPFAMIGLVEYCQGSPMARCSEDQLAQLHGLVGEQIAELMQSDNPRDRKDAIMMGIKFLKDNNVTASLNAAPALADISTKLPSADELEKLMTMTPN